MKFKYRGVRFDREGIPRKSLSYHHKETGFAWFYYPIIEASNVSGVDQVWLDVGLKREWLFVVNLRFVV